MTASASSFNTFLRSVDLAPNSNGDYNGMVMIMKQISSLDLIRIKVVLVVCGIEPIRSFRHHQCLPYVFLFLLSTQDKHICLILDKKQTVREISPSIPFVTFTLHAAHRVI